jgi:hypothetical protein
VATTEIVCSLDLGASTSKGVYDFISGKRKTTGVMTIGSMVSQIPISFLRQETVVCAEPENLAWIRYKQKDKNVILVGEIAKKYNSLIGSIDEVKYEKGIDKCLAFVGAIIVKHQLNPKDIEVTFNLLIPRDETKSKELVEETLRKKMSSFVFQNRLIEADLVKFVCCSEGLGGFFRRLEYLEEGKEWVKNKKLAILMLGHRNCSCIRIEEGGIQNAETIRLGYFDYLKDIQKNTIGQKIEELEIVVPKLGKDEENNDKVLATLIKSSNSKNRSVELKEIKKAIAESRKRFWYQLSNWMDSQVPQSLDEIQIYGGVSVELEQELFNKFNGTSSALYWGKETVEEMKNLPFAEYLVEQGLCRRFIDVFGMHKEFCTI